MNTIDVSRLKEFKDIVLTANQLNGSKNSPNYVLVKGASATFANSLSLYSLTHFDYLIAIGEKKWNIGNYQNTSACMLGLFNKDLELVDSIPLHNGCELIGVEFTTYRGSYYNEYKPVLLLKDNAGNEFKVKIEEENGYSSDFPALFNKAKDSNQSASTTITQKN